MLVQDGFPLSISRGRRLCLQNTRGKPAQGITAEEIEAAVPLFIADCREKGLTGKLHISADKGRFQARLAKLLPLYDCDRTPVAWGHDFQFPIEWSFGRAKNLAHKMINKLGKCPSQDELWEIFKKAWLQANPPAVVKDDIKKMPTVWDLIIKNKGGLVTRKQLQDALNK